MIEKQYLQNGKYRISGAIKSLNPKAEYRVSGSIFSLDNAIIEWSDNTTPISKADIQTELDRLQIEVDATQYQRDREAEYPSVQELVVGLYDADDKADIETKRAAVKAKYPKPE